MRSTRDLTPTVVDPGGVFTVDGVGCFDQLAGALLFDGATPLGVGATVEPDADGSFTIPLAVPATVRPRHGADRAGRLRQRGGGVDYSPASRSREGRHGDDRAGGPGRRRHPRLHRLRPGTSARHRPASPGAGRCRARRQRGPSIAARRSASMADRTPRTRVRAASPGRRRADRDRVRAGLRHRQGDPAGGEKVKADGGSMLAMTTGTDIETSTQGGALKGLRRAVLGGESLFMNTFTAPPQGGDILFAPKLPGDVMVMPLTGETLYLQSGAYIASEESIDIDTHWGGAKTFFSRQGLFILKVSGQGQVVVGSFGAIHAVDLQPGQTYTVGTGHLVA